ncbi:helix-hairpin-helix domain-containing protein [Pseudomonas sp. v388]|uniref:ComEA family DNA-binding protein n=1 Tax=Pseudomonas sp. v388 TaxID=2479849 RepID=UPI000F777AA3|nr:helix-hairpin-helix domain-containing protein [Pseudomonas sp. v388]RRV06992.1 helix-hairpin-helix domain-containing protein [Pseudomonas sp. v388]
MRSTLFSSLLFALLTSASVAVTAAPADNSGSMMAPAAMQAQTHMAGRVNLNSADAATLQKELAGIGKSKAEAIVAHRESNGAFTSIDELVEVKGIGKALLDKNRDRLSLE